MCTKLPFPATSKTPLCTSASANGSCSFRFSTCIALLSSIKKTQKQKKLRTDKKILNVMNPMISNVVFCVLSIVPNELSNNFPHIFHNAKSGCDQRPLIHSIFCRLNLSLIKGNCLCCCRHLLVGSSSAKQRRFAEMIVLVQHFSNCKHHICSSGSDERQLPRKPSQKVCTTSFLRRQSPIVPARNIGVGEHVSQCVQRPHMTSAKSQQVKRTNFKSKQKNRQKHNVQINTNTIVKSTNFKSKLRNRQKHNLQIKETNKRSNQNKGIVKRNKQTFKSTQTQSSTNKRSNQHKPNRQKKKLKSKQT
jgi:hypothetical protein